MNVTEGWSCIPDLAALYDEADNRFHVLVKKAGLDPAKDFISRDLRTLVFSGADLRGFDFRGSDLRGTSLRSAKHIDSSTKLNNTKLDEADLEWRSKLPEARHLEPADLIAGFQKSIDNREIKQFFSARMSLKTGEIDSIETEIRWISEDGQTAGEYVIGSIISEYPEETQHITHWSIANAVEAQRLFIRAGFNISISVNLHTSQLAIPNFAEDCVRLIAGSGANLRFNISDLGWLHETDSKDAIQKIYDVGAKFCISDFGAGYSSLGYFRLPFFSELQMDRSITHSLLDQAESRSLARSILELGRSQKLQVSAAGLETGEQLSELIRMGFDSAQGYFICRPMGREDIPAFLSNARLTNPLMLPKDAPW